MCRHCGGSNDPSCEAQHETHSVLPGTKALFDILWQEVVCQELGPLAGQMTGGATRGEQQLGRAESRHHLQGSSASMHERHAAARSNGASRGGGRASHQVLAGGPARNAAAAAADACPSSVRHTAAGSSGVERHPVAQPPRGVIRGVGARTQAAQPRAAHDAKRAIGASSAGLSAQRSLHAVLTAGHACPSGDCSGDRVPLSTAATAAAADSAAGSSAHPASASRRARGAGATGGAYRGGAGPPQEGAAPPRATASARTAVAARESGPAWTHANPARPATGAGLAPAEWRQGRVAAASVAAAMPPQRVFKVAASPRPTRSGLPGPLGQPSTGSQQRVGAAMKAAVDATDQ